MPPEPKYTKTAKEVWIDFAKDALGIDRGFYFTIKALYQRPAEVLESYLSDKGVYQSPFALLGVSLGLYYLLSGFFVDWTAVSESLKWLLDIYFEWLNSIMGNGKDALPATVMYPLIDVLIRLASTYLAVLFFGFQVFLIPLMTIFTRKHGIPHYVHVAAMNYNFSLSILMLDAFILVSLISPWLVIVVYITSLFFLPSRTLKLYGDKQEVVKKAFGYSILCFLGICIVVGVGVGFALGYSGG